MLIKNTTESYGAVTQLLHWIMFLLIVWIITVGFVMTDMENGPDKFQLYGMHKTTGVIILFLVVLRIIWKQLNTSPLLPNTLDEWQKYAARAGHVLLYALMVSMPLSGWAMSSAAGFAVSVFGWFTLPNIVAPNKELLAAFRELHEIGAYLFIITILLHITAALLHHFYYRDNVLQRILPFRKK